MNVNNSTRYLALDQLINAVVEFKSAAKDYDGDKDQALALFERLEKNLIILRDTNEADRKLSRTKIGDDLKADLQILGHIANSVEGHFRSTGIQLTALRTACNVDKLVSLQDRPARNETARLQAVFAIEQRQDDDHRIDSLAEQKPVRTADSTWVYKAGHRESQETILAELRKAKEAVRKHLANVGNPTLASVPQR